MLLVQLFIYFSHFSLLLGVRGWLRLVIVALPGLFYKAFFETFYLKLLVQRHVTRFQSPSESLVEFKSKNYETYS